jgi:hypothetical protein
VLGPRLACVWDGGSCHTQDKRNLAATCPPRPALSLSGTRPTKCCGKITLKTHLRGLCIDRKRNSSGFSQRLEFPCCRCNRSSTVVSTILHHHTTSRSTLCRLGLQLIALLEQAPGSPSIHPLLLTMVATILPPRAAMFLISLHLFVSTLHQLSQSPECASCLNIQAVSP